MTSELSVWLPRSQSGDIEICGPPSDESGQEIRLFDGADLAPEIVLHFSVVQGGDLPDFLYNLRLLMIVSSRALATIKGSLGPSDTVFPVRLALGDDNFIDGYNWINIHRRVSLLNEDLAKSVIKTSTGHYVRIDGFSVRPDVSTADELFICEETGSKVFSESLLRRVTKANLTGATFNQIEGMNWPF